MAARLLVKIADEGGAVVLADDIDHGAGEAVADGEFDAIGDVPLDDLGRFNRVVFVVGVVAVALVFGEVRRVRGLADVVEKGADAGQQGVGADGVGGVFGELSYDQRVVIGAGRFELHTAQQGVVVIGEFEQSDVGGALKKGLEHWKQTDNSDAGKQAG